MSKLWYVMDSNGIPIHVATSKASAEHYCKFVTGNHGNHGNDPKEQHFVISATQWYKIYGVKK